MKIVFPKKDVDFIFASSSINVRENKSVLRETTDKCAAAEDYPAALRIFYDSGLAREGEDFMTALDRNETELYDFLREVTDANSEPIISYLTVSQDVLELKTAVKAYVFAQESQSAQEQDARAARLAAMVREGDFSGLSNAVLEKAAKEALAESAAGRDPQTVDFILDKALFEVRSDIAGASGIKYLRTVCERDIDIKNLCAVFRAKRQGIQPDDAEKLLFDGGSIKKEDLLLLLTKPDKAVYNIRKTAYGETVKELVEDNASPSRCEKELQKLFYNGLTEALGKNYGGDKVVAYAILHVKALRDLSLVLTAKKVGKQYDRG